MSYSNMLSYDRVLWPDRALGLPTLKKGSYITEGGQTITVTYCISFTFQRFFLSEKTEHSETGNVKKHVEANFDHWSTNVGWFPWLPPSPIFGTHSYSILSPIFIPPLCPKPGCLLALSISTFHNFPNRGRLSALCR